MKREKGIALIIQYEKKAYNKAQKCIITSTDEQPLQYIMNCDTANGM